MTISTYRLGVIAGLLDGEGSFAWYRGAPTIQIQMCDEDIMRRLAQEFDVMLYGPRQPKGKPTYKAVWQLRIFGIDAVGWMMTCYSGLGERRREKIREVLAMWRASERAPRAGRNKPRIMAHCHPDRIVAGRGLCDPCYMAAFRKARGYRTSQQQRELEKDPTYVSKRKKAMAVCHPERFAWAQGLCATCYGKEWRRATNYTATQRHLRLVAKTARALLSA